MIQIVLTGKRKHRKKEHKIRNYRKIAEHVVMREEQKRKGKGEREKPRSICGTKSIRTDWRACAVLQLVIRSNGST
jgi:hypothetical protein